MTAVTTITHSVQCGARPQDILDVLLDPERFTADLPFVDAVVEEESADHQVVRFTAEVGKKRRSWSSTRTVYRHGVGFRAVLVPPMPPAASVVALWSIIPVSAAASSVTVTHEITFLQGTSPQAEQDFLSDLDVNSKKELSHLRLATEKNLRNYLPASLAASLGGFMSRVTMGPSNFAGYSLFGDLAWVSARFSTSLAQHPLDEAFWDEWLMLWEQRGDTLVARSGETDASLLRRAAGAYHWAQFLYFNDKNVKQRLRQKIKTAFRLANVRSQNIRELSLRASDSEVPCWLVTPEDSNSEVEFPWIMFVNGLDSSPEVEPMMVAEQFAHHGFATIIPELPGQGLSGTHSTLPPTFVTMVDELYKHCESLPELSDSSRYFGGISFGGQLALKMATSSQTSLRGIVNLSGGPKPVTPLPRRLQLDFIDVIGGTRTTLPEAIEAFSVGTGSRFQYPTLTVQGVHDDIYPHSDLEVMHKENPGGLNSLIALPDEGHCFLNDFEFGLRHAANWLSLVESGNNAPEVRR